MNKLEKIVHLFSDCFANLLGLFRRNQIKVQLQSVITLLATSYAQYTSMQFIKS